MRKRHLEFQYSASFFDICSVFAIDVQVTPLHDSSQDFHTVKKTSLQLESQRSKEIIVAQNVR